MSDRIYKIPPWAHQEAALNFVIDKPAAMLGMSMGTGKSRVVVDLVVNRGHLHTLILCPCAVVNVWPREFGKHAARAVNVLPLTKGNTKDKLQAAKNFLDGPPGQKVVVLNYESVWREPFGEWARSKQPPWDLVVCDESHRGKSPTGKIGKYLDRLRINARQRLCLTGTMMPHSPLDVFSQYRFLNPQVFGRWYTHFRSRYAITNPMFPSQVTRWINQDELAEKVASLAFQVGADVLDLPAALHQDIPVELSPRAMKLYRQLEEELIADVETGVVTVANGLVKLLRLQQITGGYCPEDDGPTVQVDTSKAEALTDLLEDLPATEPVIVFCRFRADLNTVRDIAKKTSRRYGELSGRENDLSPTATMRDDVDLMGVQIASGGVGVDLTRAAYCVYFSAGYSLGEYEQSLARLHRPGQTRGVRYYHLVAKDTVDEAVYEALSKKKEVVQAVLDAYKGTFREMAG